MSQPAILFDKFSFNYPQEEPQNAPLVGPLSFEIPKKSFTLLTGKTGCGKTTLLKNCKPELIPCGTRQGEISLLGKSITSLGVQDSTHLVGYVSQNADNQLICSEVWHELAFGLENCGTDQKLMRRRIAELAHFFGMNSWLHQSVPTLSGGQKQLLVLASTLALEPRILLLDEPTSQLDPVAAHSFLHALFRVNRELGITVVVATHFPELMTPYATNHIELTNGILIQKPSPAQTPRGYAINTNNPIDESSAIDTTASKDYPDKTSRLHRSHKISHNALTIKNVAFRYNKKDPLVLRDCSLSVAPQTLHAVVGANACGKSTLLSLAAGTIRPERGVVKNTFATSQGYIPQDPKALFVCDSVLEELKEWQPALSYSNKDISSLLEQLNLLDCVKQHPYDLSGGQAQLLAFAKVILTRPQLLLLDEATKGLDAQTKLTVATLCKSLIKNGTTILLVTHDLEFAYTVADEITMLFDGMDVCTEPAHTFFKNNLFYKPQTTEFTRLWNTRRNIQ